MAASAAEEEGHVGCIGVWGGLYKLSIGVAELVVDEVPGAQVAKQWCSRQAKLSEELPSAVAVLWTGRCESNWM